MSAIITNILTWILMLSAIILVFSVPVDARPKRDLQALERIMREIVENSTGSGSAFRPG